MITTRGRGVVERNNRFSEGDQRLGHLQFTSTSSSTAYTVIMCNEIKSRMSAYKASYHPPSGSNITPDLEI
jgi:hypothetical protein